MNSPCVTPAISAKTNTMMSTSFQTMTEYNPSCLIRFKGRDNPSKIGCPVSWEVLDLSNILIRLLNKYFSHLTRPKKLIKQSPLLSTSLQSLPTYATIFLGDSPFDECYS